MNHELQKQAVASCSTCFGGLNLSTPGWDWTTNWAFGWCSRHIGLRLMRRLASLILAVVGCSFLKFQDLRRSYALGNVLLSLLPLSDSPRIPSRTTRFLNSPFIMKTSKNWKSIIYGFIFEAGQLHELEGKDIARLIYSHGGDWHTPGCSGWGRWGGIFPNHSNFDMGILPSSDPS